MSAFNVERADALIEEMQLSRARVAQLLAELDQIDAWQALAASPPLHATLGQRRVEAATELVDLLVTWRRAGGTVEIDLPRAPLQAATPWPAGVVPVPDETELQVAQAVEEVAAPEEADADDRVDETPAPPAVAAAPLSPAAHVPAARPALPPASAEAIAGLKSRFESGGAFAVPAQDNDWPVTLAEVVRDLVPGRDPEADLNAILRVVDAVDRWYGLPADAQRYLAAHLAARLRTLQDVAFPDDRRVGHAFGVLSAFMKKARPGFVFGLARTHRPGRDTWEADADAFFDRLLEMLPQPPEDAPPVQRRLDMLEGLVHEIDAAPAEARSAVEAQVRREMAAVLAAGVSSRNVRLVRMATPILATLEGSEFRALRRAIRDEQEAAAAEGTEESVEPSPLPADWPWWAHTRGRRAVMVGGSPRELNRARLQRIFEFAELTWMPAEFRRNSLQAVRDRVRAGGLDLVLILRSFVGHDADQVILPACREMQVGWASVEQGYGVARVRQAIERYLDPDDRRA